MNKQRVEVRTQIEFEAALKLRDTIIDIVAGVYELVTRGLEAPFLTVAAGVELKVEAWGSSQPHVVAWGSSQPHVVAWESSQPHVVAWESSQPHVEAWGSSQPYVVARESSQPYVVARESSQPYVVARESSQPQVVARESSQPHVVASGYVQLSLFGLVVAKVTAKVAVLIRGHANVEGGQQTRIEIKTPQDWCDYYGIAVEDGIAVLYKALNAEMKSGHGFPYEPGSTPEATDWDGDKRECGGGLHFSPSPKMALEFISDAKRFAACPVSLDDMRAPQDGDIYPQKIKAKRALGS